MKTFNVMDLKNKYRFIHYDSNKNKTVLNSKIFDNAGTINISNADPQYKYIINAECDNVLVCIWY